MNYGLSKYQNWIFNAKYQLIFFEKKSLKNLGDHFHVKTTLLSEISPIFDEPTPRRN